MLLDKAKKDLTDARDEADDAQRGAITMFNEQKRYESHIQRLQSEVHRSSSFLLHYLLDEPRIVSAECATRSASIRLMRIRIKTCVIKESTSSGNSIAPRLKIIGQWKNETPLSWICDHY